MTGGSAQQEKATDQQCRHCHLWFDGRGIKEHEKRCDGESPDRADGADRDAGTSGGDGSDVFDPDRAAASEVVQEDDQEDTNMDTPECEDCETKAWVITAEAAFDRIEGSHMDTEENREMIEENDWVCTQCLGAW